MFALFPSSLTLSFLGLVISFYLLAPHFKTTKQAAWILTTLSSATMSLASLPFLLDYLASGGSVKGIRAMPDLAIAANRFFQAYLAADLLVGSICYRSSISLLEGWVHHSVYILVVELAIRRSWAHIFCLCGSMEIPTFILGFTILFPRLRSKVLFAVAFFMTRISLHIVLAISYFFYENRIHATGGSFVPSIILACVFPLHAMWFTRCIKGFIRRTAQKRPTPSIPSVVELTIVPGAPVSRLTKPSEPTSPPTRTVRLPLRLRLSHRRQSFEMVFRSFRADFLESPSSRRALLSRAISPYIPRRETVYQYVGLGRTRGLTGYDHIDLVSESRRR